jgi:hypothetical protein
VERYISPLSNGTSFVNFDAILRKLQLFSKISCFMFIQMINFLQFLNQHSMTSKTMSRIFPVMFQSLLKPHYVYTAWLHCEEILSFWSNHCWFMIQGQSWSVPMAHLWLLFKKMGYQEDNYKFWCIQPDFIRFHQI